MWPQTHKDDLAIGMWSYWMLPECFFFFKRIRWFLLSRKGLCFRDLLHHVLLSNIISQWYWLWFWMVKEFLYSQCYLPRSCAACICPFRQKCSGVVGHPMGSSSADIDQCPRAVNQYRYRMCPCGWRMSEMGKKRAPSDFQKQIFSRKWAIDAQSTKEKVEHECGRFELYCYWMSQNSLFFSNIENEYCCYNQLNYTNKENQIWRQRGHKQYHRCHKVLKYISAKHRLPKFHSTTRG